VTIPAYVAAWLLLSALAPVWVPGALIVGVIRRRSLIVFRLLFLFWVYLTIELIGLLRAASIHAFAPRTERETRFFRLTRWWGTSLFGWIRRVLALELIVEGDDQILPGPLLVLERHASIIDTILPVVLISDAKGLPLRYVFKRELLVDPCIDVAGHAWPNYFINRSGESEREIAGVRALAENLQNEGVLIYPEGTRFTSQKHARALHRLAERHPELVPAAQAMQHVLPPKPGGVLALLDAAPNADCLIVAHRGLEGFAEVKDLFDGKIVGGELRVKMWRISSRDIPPEPERARWLFDVWKDVDRFAGERC
jgi:1-acyl-sn-glycerol-3-phosphate acyltransferase